MKPKIYIAGPMRGYEYYNFPAFDAARDKLQAAGFDVFSPADNDREHGFDPQNLANYDWDSYNEEIVGSPLRDVIKRDLDELQECSAIYLLDGWAGSRGAYAEFKVAQWLGLIMIHDNDQL